MPDVVSYLSMRPNEPVTLEQLSLGTGVEAGRLQKAMSNAMSTGAYGNTIECVHRGRVWKWLGEGHAAPAMQPPPRFAPTHPTHVTQPKPEGLTKGDMVEVMGATQNGDAVASDENGRLYRVVPL